MYCTNEYIYVPAKVTILLLEWSFHQGNASNMKDQNKKKSVFFIVTTDTSIKLIQVYNSILLDNILKEA